jgi:hypothetical protein
VFIRRRAWATAAACALLGCNGGADTPTDSGVDATASDAVAEAADASFDATADAAPDAADGGPVDVPACVQATLATLVATPVVHYAPQPSCGASMPVCCQGGDAGTMCGDVALDFGLQQGDSARLTTSLVNAGTTLDVTMRARVSTSPDIPVTINPVGSCTLHLDTLPGPTADIQYDFQVLFVTIDGGPSAIVQNVAVTTLTTDDFTVGGSVGCGAVTKSLITGSVDSMLVDQLTTLIEQAFASAGCT